MNIVVFYVMFSYTIMLYLVFGRVIGKDIDLIFKEQAPVIRFLIWVFSPITLLLWLIWNVAERKF